MRLLTWPQAPSNVVAEETALGHRELIMKPVAKAANARLATQLVTCNRRLMEHDVAVVIGTKELEGDDCFPLLLPLPNCRLCELQ